MKLFFAVVAACLVACSAIHAVDARSTTLSKLLAPRNSQSGVLPKLKKATVIDPMASSGAEEALTNIAKLLGKEPPAASEDADALLEDEDSEDVMSAEDLALMGEDSCDKDPSTPKCAAKSEESSFIEKDEEEENLEDKEQSGTDLLQISESESKRSSHSGSSSSSRSGSSSSSSSSMSPVEKEIRKLENMIRKAMKVSHTIPDAVKRLEELKQASEKETEERARQEATKTLEEHRRLMSEMGEHITKLQNKLNELVAKRAQLSASDARLRRELGQFSDSSSSSHSSSDSSTA